MIRSRRDIVLLFTARVIRMGAYGFLSVVLVLYLAQIGLSDESIGLLLTLTLAGDAAISLWLTAKADRVGRRWTLIAGAILMAAAGGGLLFTTDYLLLVLAATIGVVSPSGKEIGPFLSIEQAALTNLLPDARRTRTFGWYNLAGSAATAIGALIGGGAAQLLQEAGLSPIESYRYVLAGYAVSGACLILVFAALSPSIEAPVVAKSKAFGLHASQRIVVKLSALFAVDAFAGGFIVQSLVAYWFYVKFGVDIGTLGAVFFGVNALAAISALVAAHIAERIGLVRTMVFTHLPSNILLCAIPFMPTFPLAVVMFLARSSISQMDVPTRQSYTMAVVAPEERSAASGITTVARSVGASGSPVLTGIFLAHPALLGFPFILAGGIKMVYDLLLFNQFKSLRPPEERSNSNLQTSDKKPRS